MHTITNCLAHIYCMNVFVVFATGFHVIHDESPPPVRVALSATSSSAASAAVAAHPAPQPLAFQHWSCDACTVLNPPSAAACDVCNTPRPVPAPVPAAVSAPRPVGYWACPQCTLENNIDRSRCNACGAAAPAAATAGTVSFGSPRCILLFVATLLLEFHIVNFL